MDASTSPESPSKKRKQTDRGAQLRREPLFASRRSVASLQQPPDFLTDSLNTSHIPSPSPTRSPTRPDLAARPRRAGPKRPSRTKSTSNTSDLPQEIAFFPRPTELEVGGHRGQAKKTQSQQPREESIPRSAPLASSPQRIRTPTPPRGRTLPVETSPANSEPSPGRGYTEAYQRIVEEENLAHEESIDDIDPDELDGSYNHVSQDIDQYSRPLSRIKSSSPSPYRSRSKLASPISDDPRRMGDTEAEDLTRSSLDSGSSQHKKDLELLSKIKSQPVAFRRAQMGDRASPILDNLQRRASNESLHSARSAGSFSIASEPSLNVPKAWGRKAKPNTEWLNRINNRRGRPDTSPVQDLRRGSEKDDGYIQKNDDKVDNWMAAADVVVPGSEGRASQLAHSSHSVSADRQQPQPALISRHTWNIDDDFTGRSLQVSDSPPIKLGKAFPGLDDTQELKHIEFQAVPENQVNAPSEQAGPVLQRTSSESRNRSQGNARSERNVVKDEAGEQVPDTPVIIYRPKHTMEKPEDKEAKADSSRPPHQRRDSHEILKRLARAASQSPSPEKDESNPPKEQTTNPNKNAPKSSKPKAQLQTPIVSGAWVDQSANDTRLAPKTVKNTKTPRVTGGWIDTPMPTQSQEEKAPFLNDIKEESPNTTVGAADLLKELHPQSKPSPKKPKAQEPLRYSGPPLPTSSLRNILDRARGGPHLPLIAGSDVEEETLPLGDGTIQSLEDLVVDGKDLPTILPASPPEPATSSSSDPSPQQNQVRNRKYEDLDSQTHLLSRLTSLAPSLRDSKKQLAALERSISAPAPQAKEDEELDTCIEGGPIHDFLLPCSKCGKLTHLSSQPSPLPGYLALKDNLSALPAHMNSLTLLPSKLRSQFTTLPDLRPYHPSLPSWPSLHLLGHETEGFTHLHLTLPIPKLWYWPPSSSRPRLTWLGLAVLFYIFWDLLEYWACLNYCHPWWGAWEMEGYGIDITAPQPPFVFAKVVWGKWGLRELVMGEGWVGGVIWPFMVLGKILKRIVETVVVYLVDFVFGGEGAGGENVLGHKSTIHPQGGSMMEDEYL